MATPTVRELIRRSLQLIGAVTAGVPPSAEEAQDGLVALNDMIDTWSLERMLIVARLRSEFTLAVGQQTRTLGVGGNFNAARPIKIERMALVTVSNPSYETPIEIVDQDKWSSISVKSTSGDPVKCWIDYGYPLITLSFYPVPATANKVALYLWSAMTAFATLDTVVSLAPGFAKALRYNLAVELAPEYGKTPSEDLVEQAEVAKEKIKRANLTSAILGIDNALVAAGGFNIQTG
jgi:hypothetical protein